MPAMGHKGKGLLGKLLLTTALVAVSAGLGWWVKQDDAKREAAAALAALQAASTDNPGGYVFNEGPAAGAIAMPAGRHLEDGDYVTQEWESGFGTVKLKVHIRNGAFIGADYLLMPDERLRSQELTHMAKPLLIHEIIHDQKTNVDVITTATYTSWAFQDAMADAVEQAIRPRLTAKQIADAQGQAHNLPPLYMGNQ